jgi:diguanylate cyclase
MSMIDSAIGTSNGFSQSLAGAQQEIIRSDDRDQLRLIVETLVRATKEVEEANQTLQKRLVDSREEINELQENLEVVRTESLTDPLTTLANRKFYEDSIKRFSRMRNRAKRRFRSFSPISITSRNSTIPTAI